MSLSFIRGLVAAVNPCGFILLPTYLMYFLGVSGGAPGTQKASITRAKKSLATFKLREGNPIGCRVTLRGNQMWEFYDRLVSLAIPRIRDFRGLSPKSFDGNGNYTFGVTEQLIFPEIDYDSIDVVRGMDITLVTTATNNDHGRALLSALEFPFRKEGT